MMGVVVGRDKVPDVGEHEGGYSHRIKWLVRRFILVFLRVRVMRVVGWQVRSCARGERGRVDRVFEKYPAMQAAIILV